MSHSQWSQYNDNEMADSQDSEYESLVEHDNGIGRGNRYDFQDNFRGGFQTGFRGGFEGGFQRAKKKRYRMGSDEHYNRYTTNNEVNEEPLFSHKNVSPSSAYVNPKLVLLISCSSQDFTFVNPILLQKE